jgi:DNA-binding PadR family transcriptional regulator
MLATRILILGAVQIFEPVHGYIVRRELTRWQADEWANLNPGSVYNALRTLALQGFTEEVVTDEDSRGPQRTTYRLTAAGRDEFLELVRHGLSIPAPHSPQVLHAALCFAWVLPRAEVLPLLECRVEEILRQRREAAADIEGLLADATRPDHVAEVIAVREMRLGGELDWTRSLIERIREGSYTFVGEQGGPWYVPAVPLPFGGPEAGP